MTKCATGSDWFASKTPPVFDTVSGPRRLGLALPVVVYAAPVEAPNCLRSLTIEAYRCSRALRVGASSCSEKLTLELAVAWSCSRPLLALAQACSNGSSRSRMLGLLASAMNPIRMSVLPFQPMEARSFQKHAESQAAWTSNPPQRAAVALVGKRAVLPQLRPAARRTARPLDGDRGQASLHLIRFAFMGLFDHAALLPVSPNVTRTMRNRREFQGFFA